MTDQPTRIRVTLTPEAREALEARAATKRPSRGARKPLATSIVEDALAVAQGECVSRSEIEEALDAAGAAGQWLGVVRDALGGGDG